MKNLIVTILIKVPEVIRMVEAYLYAACLAKEGFGLQAEPGILRREQGWCVCVQLSYTLARRAWYA